jgi:hypothetical protein
LHAEPHSRSIQALYRDALFDDARLPLTKHPGCWCAPAASTALFEPDPHSRERSPSPCRNFIPVRRHRFRYRSTAPHGSNRLVGSAACADSAERQGFVTGQILLTNSPLIHTAPRLSKFYARKFANSDPRAAARLA